MKTRYPILSTVVSLAILVVMLVAISSSAGAQTAPVVIAPNGGERYEMTDPIVIEWSAPDARALRVEYSPNGGRTWILIDSAVDASLGTLTFTPGYPTPFARVRITDVDRPELLDASDANFTILEAPSIAIFTPSESDRLIRGETYVINWLAGRIAHVNIEYSPTAGSPGSWQRIASNVDARRGYFVWTVPTALTALGKIRILDVDGPTIGETGIFSVVDPPAPQPALRVLRPNGGEVYTVGDVINVAWTSANVGPTVTIALSSDAGATWQDVVTNVPTSAGVASFTADAVLVPVPGTRFRVRVLSSNGTSDASDANFEIRRLVAPRITVLYPNGGERFETDSTIAVTWTAVDISGTVDIEYSPDAGATWTSIGSADAATGTISWEIPDELTDSALVRVIGGPIGDSSNAVFAIVEPESNVSIVVLTPNDATEEWREATIATITWTATGVARVDITLSTDGGASWSTTIAQNIPATPGSFTWRVPHLADTNLTSLLVRVSVAGGSAPFDYSNAPFRFRPTFAAVDGELAHSRILVAPNPARSQARVEWRGSMRALYLFDMSGTIVRSMQLDGDRRDAVLDLEALPRGTYLCELRGDAVRERIRLVVR
jgi:hypothetical protein